MTTDAIQDEIMAFADSQPNFRANVPEGTLVGSTEVEGGQFNWRKPNSLVRIGNKSLPERMQVYDTRTGQPSMIPTGAATYHLNKRRPDGTRVFSRNLPEGVVEPQPIADTCKICYVKRGNLHRNFYTEYDLIAHYQAFHTLEWTAMERERDMQERRDSSSRMERLILSLLGRDQKLDLPADVANQISDLQKEARK